jgi:hypothetical protein
MQPGRQFDPRRGGHGPSRVFALAALLCVAGCATTATPDASRPDAPVADAADTASCPTDRVALHPDYCELPAEVRAFMDDRDLCDNFRGEPWPEGDTGADKDRRRHLVEAVRTHCAGTDRRLEALLARYPDDGPVRRALLGYERSIETLR